MNNKELTVEDRELLKYYMMGFNDELYGTSSTVPEKFNRAYSLGADAAIIGDDIPEYDYQTDKEILKDIKNDK